MRRLLSSVLATVLPLAAASAAVEFPKLGAFEPGSGKIWFSGCTFEADRYVSCKSAAPEVIEAISNPGDQTPGLALQTFVSDVFIEKGCAFEAAPESFRVNGIFLSFDSNAAKDIRCKGKAATLVFGPEGMSLQDTVFFFRDGPAE
ncbi:hypothetical protein [Hyphomicrobium sp.]|uniref:hypothetical protein n=1 Tax=Hyphomicrobium sp. TaxID=82 RepID=UPI002FE2811E